MATEKKPDDHGNVATAPPPEPPKPYPAPGYPKVLFSKTDRVAPRLVNNDEELEALDPNQWTQIPPVAPKEKPTWPKLYAHVFNTPKWVASQEEADALGSDWREFPLPKPAHK